MPEFKFLITTQDDKGAHTRKNGWVQEVNSHSAAFAHARRRNLKSLARRGCLDRKSPSENRVKVACADPDERPAPETAVIVSNASGDGRLTVRSAESIAPREIISSLDPFIRLPVDCSEGEKSLLAFHLQHGRRNILGTRATPKYDIALHAGRQQIESNPIWAWSHIVMAEEIISKLTYRPRSPTFYRRRACAYADTKRLLLDDSVSVPAKLATLVMLQVMESCIGNWGLQAMHSDAIDQIVAANGGLTLFLRNNKGQNDMVEPIWFLSIWRAGVFKLLPRAEFTEASSSLCDFLHEIRQWAVSVNKSDTDLGRRQCNMIALAPLIKYLNDLIYTHLRLEDETSSLTFQGLASFALVFHLCGTFSRLSCDLAMATKFLICFQEYLEDSFSDPGGSLPEPSKSGVMHLNGVTSMLSHIRRQVDISGVPLFSLEQEVQLCIASMHAVKVFPMLCKATRLRLAQHMLNCALVSTQDDLADAFGEGEVEDLRTELDMSWCQASENQSRHGNLDMTITPFNPPWGSLQMSDSTGD